jgi:hypothetical protein
MTMGFTKRRPEKETMMKEWLRAACCGIVLWGCAGSLACAPVTTPPPPPSTPVSLSTFESVAGKWAGIMRTTPRLREDDWVTLIIRKDGAYAFEAVRTIGIMQGQGTFTLTDGKLRAETERGWAEVTLYEEGERRMLKIAGATKDGVQYSAALAPQEVASRLGKNLFNTPPPACPRLSLCRIPLLSE